MEVRVLTRHPQKQAVMEGKIEALQQGNIRPKSKQAACRDLVMERCAALLFLIPAVPLPFLDMVATYTMLLDRLGHALTRSHRWHPLLYVPNDGFFRGLNAGSWVI